MRLSGGSGHGRSRRADAEPPSAAMTVTKASPPAPGDPINASPVHRLLVLAVVAAYNNRTIRRILWRRTRSVVTVRGLCIKVKPSGSLSEAHTMRYVAEHTSIPVPKTYCAFVRNGTSYHVMSRVEGKMALDCWKLRSGESRARVLAQLRRMVAELRAVPRPAGTVVGNIQGGPFFDPRLPKKSFWGPFATVAELHRALLDGNDPGGEYRELPGDMRRLFDFYRESQHELVLTHGDLSSLNIMVDGDKVVGIVDWETAGWLPSYWEYTTAKYANPCNEFWADEVDHFMDPSPYEWEMDTIRRKYFGDI